jgi:Saxitoxin biosynthesis operon protein SxtJ
MGKTRACGKDPKLVYSSRIHYAHFNMFHENLSENVDPKVKSPKTFGLTFAALFSVLGILPLLRHGHVRVWSVIVGLLLLILAVWLPRLLAPLERAWSLVGSVLNRIMTPVLMAVVFILVITPVALIRRAIGSSGLALRFDPGLDTYWISRDRPVVDAESLKRQF